MGKISGVAYITGASTIKIHGGVVDITDVSGSRRLKRAMSVKIFEANQERGQRALDRYRRGEESVIVDD